MENWSCSVSSLSTCFLCAQDTEKAGYKCVVLNPSLVSSFKDLQDVESTLTENEVEAGDLVDQQFTLDGSNWKPHEKLKSILPEAGLVCSKCKFSSK